jgi:hypothetical protein
MISLSNGLNSRMHKICHHTFALVSHVPLSIICVDMHLLWSNRCAKMALAVGKYEEKAGARGLAPCDSTWGCSTLHDKSCGVVFIRAFRAKRFMEMFTCSCSQLASATNDGCEFSTKFPRLCHDRGGGLTTVAVRWAFIRWCVLGTPRT